MLARFEGKTLTGNSHISAHKYESLQNLPHWHMEYELVFCDSGSARVNISGEQYDLTEGHCLFIGSGEIHNIVAAAGSMVSVIKMERRLVEVAFDGKVPICPLIYTGLPLTDIFAQLAAELQEKKAFSGVICDCMAVQLLAQLLRGIPLKCCKDSSDNVRYKNLLSYIETHYADITFSEAATFMCYSKPYFSRYFSAMTGMTFSSYLNIIRIAEAVSMISEKTFTMTEIAHATGFGTIRHFNRVFRELTGFSPSCLPEDYVFVRYRQNASAEGFDPTISAPAIL